MATVASASSYIPLPPVSETEVASTPTAGTSPSTKRFSFDAPAISQAVHKSPYSTGGVTKGYTNPFANWHNYSMNANVNVNYAEPEPIPSPPLTMSSNSPHSSNNSSPAEPSTNSHAHSPIMPSYFSSQGFSKQRSKSFAIPAPTSCCPNCGLRRPSAVADHTLSTSISSSVGDSRLPSIHRPHLPLHLHCPDFCPDDHFPSTKAGGGQTMASPLSKQRHHRRRSSLCYAESLVEDAEIMDNGRVPDDVKLGWERQAESIARNVVLRKSGLEGFKVVEEEAIED